MPVQDPDRLRAELRPFEEAELALVRAVVSRPPWISEPDENALRPSRSCPAPGSWRGPSRPPRGELNPDMPLLARMVRPFAPPV